MPVKESVLVVVESKRTTVDGFVEAGELVCISVFEEGEEKSVKEEDGEEEEEDGDDNDDETGRSLKKRQTCR